MEKIPSGRDFFLQRYWFYFISNFIAALLHLSKLINLNLFINCFPIYLKMKHFFFLIITTIVFFSCDKDENLNSNNPYLPNYPVNLQIDKNLPAYDNLNYPSNAVYINSGNAGVRGVIVFNTGSGYTAFDAACPNQALSACSTMTIDGVNAVCPCDEKEYSLFTGLASGAQYPMKQYRVSVTGSVIYVTN